MNKQWVATVKDLVKLVIGQQVSRRCKPVIYKTFNNVWLQDSTTIQLPEVLYKLFSCKVMDGKKKAVAKLNVVVNAISGACVLMKWHKFIKTEQTLTDAIFDIAKEGDLVIRDLGYFVLDAFRRLDEAKIYFLSRYRYGVVISDSKSGERICLLDLLKNKKWIDIEVLCGEREQLKVRLVAFKLSEDQKNERIRKAKSKHHRDKNHNPEYYALLGYVILITNVKKSVWNYKAVADAYRIRWNIEILFKSWKSGLGIESIIPEAYAKSERVESVLYLMLLYITWFQLRVIIPLQIQIPKNGKYLSVFKLIKWIKLNTLAWILSELTPKMKREIEYQCCYDLRHDKTNAGLRLSGIFKLLT